MCKSDDEEMDMTGTLVYTQCTNSDCLAIGCRKVKDHMNGSFCKLCKTKMVEIKWNDYEYKLHYTTIPHEEGLLQEIKNEKK